MQQEECGQCLIHCLHQIRFQRLVIFQKQECNNDGSASDTYSDTFYRRCFLCRDVSSETFIEANYNPNHKDNQGKLTRKEELSKVVESSEKIAEIMDELPGGFGKTLKYHMERLDINEEELSYRTGTVIPCHGYLSESPFLSFTLTVSPVSP